MNFQKVTIIVVGLLGGQLGLALKQEKLSRRAVGFVGPKPSIPERIQFRAVALPTPKLRKALTTSH